MTATVATTCECGCGRSVEGRRTTRRYSSASCRKRAERARGGQGGLSNPRSDSVHEGVTLTRSRPVHCAGCAEPMPKLEGPLPVAAYCRDCVDGGRP